MRTEYINDLVAPISQVLLKQVQGNWWKGEKTIRYVYGGSRISQSAEGKTHFYLYDSIGRNVSALVSLSGKVLNSYKYDTFGGPFSDEQEVPNVYQYCGEQFDEETGLIYLRNRYYDPEIGRFISKDSRPGRLNRPATLNPYCYVENNPVNFVDPWGFEAIEPEELELVIIYNNGLPGWFGGQGIGGHVFIGFPARKDTTPFFGNYPKTPSIDEAVHVNAKTLAVVAYCNSQKVTKAIEVMQDIKWTQCNNCVHTVLEGMKIMEFPHAEKIRLSPIPVPMEFQSQMLKLHERDPVRPISYPREEINSPSGSPSLGFNFSPSLDFGGVSLSKTAELQLSLADIAGAAFDPVTGQLILFGPQDRYLPPVDLDDLAVAVRSVYGIGTLHPQDPGVSIGTEPSTVLGQMKVRYDGATINTSFGQVMFEADRLLKCLALGKDNISGQAVLANVPGYSSLVNREVALQLLGQTSHRMWFVPDQITLVEAEDHKGMVFSDVRMKVLTESQFNGSSIDEPASREFAEHFTANFDNFSKQFPILEKLKTLGKITAIVKWIRENNIPFDVSFFLNYQPKMVTTSKYTPSTESRVEWNLIQVERRHVAGHKKKRDVPVPYPKITTLTGGIDYTLNSRNFASYVDPAANDFTSSALKSRPSEQDFTWSFRSPTNRETFIAVAQSVYRTRKPGNVKKSYVDMNFPVPGNHQLSLRRFYNSFSEQESALGRGWRIAPYELELPLEKVTISSQDGKTCATHKVILVRAPEGEYLYEPFTFSSDDCPVFKSPHYAGFLKDNLNGTFSLFIPHSERVDFDQHGKLLNILDNNGFTIEYQYRDRQLISIRHQNGAAILLEYDGNRLIKASGPENTAIRYIYHPDGQLWTVGDANGPYLHYLYDLDKRLKKITDRLENVLFEAAYDDYNRASLVKEGAASYHADFSLEKRIMKISDGHGRECVLQYDDKDRLIHKQDSRGLTWEFAYEQDNIQFPTKITDPKGGITECHYDLSGNPIYFKNPVGAEWRFFYDLSGNLTAHREPNGRAVVNFYGEKNQINQTYFKAFLEIDENDRFATNYGGFSADGQYAVYFGYDEKTGQLTSRTNMKEAQTSFTYHKNGLQKEIFYPTGYMVEQKTDEKGKIFEISDGFGIQKCFDYDGVLLKAVRTPAGSTHFTYYEGGDLKQITDPKGFTTSYGYDSQHNLKEVTDGEGGISSYKHNSFNQLIHISLPNGFCKTIEYDSFGRLYKEIWGE